MLPFQENPVIHHIEGSCLSLEKLEQILFPRTTLFKLTNDILDSIDYSKISILAALSWIYSYLSECLSYIKVDTSSFMFISVHFINEFILLVIIFK